MSQRTFTAAEMLQNAELLVGGLDQHGCYLGNPLYLTEAAAMLRQAAAASDGRQSDESDAKDGEIEALNESSEREAALREELAMASRETARLLAVNGESNAVCSCGCELVDHEERGEDGWSCDNESHECVPTSMAVSQMLQALREENERLKRNSYPHMCRDEHQQIGHTDSEHERCPLCQVADELRAERQKVQELREWIEARWLDSLSDINKAMYQLFADKCDALGLSPTEPTP